ncbi:MAG: hypothetical protein WB053_04450, partial [Nitrososphaeraceae archaeon]
MSISNNNQDGLKTAKDIYALLLKEIQLPPLQPIPLETYQTIANNLSRLKGQGYEGLEVMIRDRMIELISQATVLLLERRLQKIVEQQQSTTSYQSSSASDTLQTTNYPRLTDEEKYILDAEIDSSKRKDYVLEAT